MELSTNVKSIFGGIRMKNKVDETKWKPIVTEHPEPEKRYRKSTPNKQPEYQPLSERYEVPGLMPPAPRKCNPDDKPY